FGDAKVANCASCHGFHDILPPEDPRSSVSPERLSETCGGCHRQAKGNKKLGRIHVGAEAESSKLQYYIKAIYILMIAGSIGGMLFYIGTDLFGFFVRRRRRGIGAREDGGHSADPNLPDNMDVERWPVGYRAQHFVLVFSFSVLVLTGMPLALPDFFLFKPITEVKWLYNMRGFVHRAAGFLMIAMCIYHVFYIITNRHARKDILNMIPKPKDALDGLNSVLYNLTIKDEHPHMPRYNFIEKFEYLAMVWGSFVMVATGLVLTFNTPLLQYLPKWAFDVATLVHKFEAILATLSIIVWHIYTVHLCPDFFPMNRVFLTGKISLRNLRKHHSEEYEELAGRLGEKLEEKEHDREQDETD
ncbi:MAG: cytochrome b/b6 domain-containing protein, partial [bacterium]